MHSAKEVGMLSSNSNQCENCHSTYSCVNAESASDHCCNIRHSASSVRFDECEAENEQEKSSLVDKSDSRYKLDDYACLNDQGIVNFDDGSIYRLCLVSCNSNGKLNTKSCQLHQSLANQCVPVCMRFVYKQDAPSVVELIKARTASLEDMQNDCANSLQPAVCEVHSDADKKNL